MVGPPGSKNINDLFMKQLQRDGTEQSSPSVSRSSDGGWKPGAAGNGPGKAGFCPQVLVKHSRTTAGPVWMGKLTFSLHTHRTSDSHTAEQHLSENTPTAEC
ncbi:hypothetical protein ILYODFUR_035450 [Ilyodon furcidens]|uniref:Uncharacterized protein n=1 Tax=Ilyodon furcidens TaxID=33524 RepID=A0ABV0U265_9TELE